jgi:TatD DNase family protein
VYINAHTHRQIYDAKLELVNLSPDNPDKPKAYSYGLHPWYIDEQNWEHDFGYLEVAAHEKRCLAIGECGLDKLSKVPFDLQEEVFIKHIVLANKVQKPLVIHCVKAFNELINLLNFNDNTVPVIIHGFNNNENIARILVNEGHFFSFGKALLGYDSNAAKALKTVGRKKFFLETDDADISIKYIYSKASDILGIDEEIVKAQIQSNFETVFKHKL